MLKNDGPDTDQWYSTSSSKQQKHLHGHASSLGSLGGKNSLTLNFNCLQYNGGGEKKGKGTQ